MKYMLIDAGDMSDKLRLQFFDAPLILCFELLPALVDLLLRGSHTFLISLASAFFVSLLNRLLLRSVNLHAGLLPHGFDLFLRLRDQLLRARPIIYRLWRSRRFRFDHRTGVIAVRCETLKLVGA